MGTDGYLLAPLRLVSSWLCWPYVSYLGWEKTHGGETSIPRTSDVGVEAIHIAGWERMGKKGWEDPGKASDDAGAGSGQGPLPAGSSSQNQALKDLEISVYSLPRSGEM